MANTTRRNVLKLAGASVAALSLGGEAARADQMLGEPPSGSHADKKTVPVSVMSIAAHPGDTFFVMGAPVALATHQGAKGYLVSLTLGDKGSATIPPAQYGVMQKDAAEKAAASLGAQALFLHYGDGSLPDNDEAAFAVCDFIRQCKPDVVVTHWKESMHKDHRACHKIVENAIFYAALPGFVRERPAHTVQSLYFADSWEDAKGFAADTYLDVTPAYDEWIKACSIFPMWRGETGFRYDDYYASRATGCGCLSGYKKAVALMSSAEQRIEHVRVL